MTLSGLLGVQRNTTAAPVNRQIQVGSGAYAISVPAGPSFSQFGGQGIIISLLGQQLTGDLTVTSPAPASRSTWPTPAPPSAAVWPR